MPVEVRGRGIEDVAGVKGRGEAEGGGVDALQDTAAVQLAAVVGLPSALS